MVTFVPISAMHKVRSSLLQYKQRLVMMMMMELSRLKHAANLSSDVRMGLSIFTNADMEPDIEAISVPKSCCITADLASRQILSFVGQAQEETTNILTGKEWIVLYLFLHRVILLIDYDSASAKEEERKDSSRKRARCVSNRHYFEIFIANMLFAMLAGSTGLI